jgi:hypothetical protein
MIERIISADADTGVVEKFKKDELTGKFAIERSQDVSDIIKANKIDINAKPDNWKGDMHHVARIPLIVIEQWADEMRAKGYKNCNPLAPENKSYLISKINNSEFSALRTKRGRI